MTTTEPTADQTGAPVSTAGAIDCDVHHHFRNGVRDLAPYLDDAWRKRTGVGQEEWANNLPAAQFQMPFTSYMNPGGSMRPDAVPPDGGPPCSDPQYAIKDHLDRYDLKAAVLIGGSVLGISGFADADLASAIATAHNQWMADVWLSSDPRWLGSIVVAPQDVSKAVAEVEKWASDPRMVQIYVPNMHMSLGKRYYWPLFEVAEHHGIPVGTHPGGEAAGMNGAMTAIDTPSYYFDWHTSLDQLYQRHAISLVAEGVFEQFPKLKVGLIEGGFAWLPGVMWKMDKNWKGLREEVPWLKRLPSEYMREHIRVTTQPVPEPPHDHYLHWLLEMMHADKMLMFSTDYPHWDGDSPEYTFKRIPQELWQTMMVDTPMAYYRMPQG